MEQNVITEDYSDELYEDSSRSLTRSKRQRLFTLVFIVLAAGVAVSYAFGWFKNSDAPENAYAGPPPAPVVVAQAKKMTMAPHTVLPGTVVSLRDAVIASETSGKILSVANVGDLVKTGDVIAHIDSRNAEQLVEQRQAELARLKSLLTYHSDYFDRIGVADNKLGVSEVGIAELRSNRDTAKADVARAEAALRAAKNDLERTKIVAPFPGAVVSQSIQQGEYAQIGSPIVRLVDTENLEVSAQVPAALVQPVVAGSSIEISGMGKTIQAPLRTLVPVGNATSRTMELRVELNNSDLLVGSPVRVSLPSAPPKEVIAIPRDAVILRTDSEYVFVVEGDIASRKEVKLGYGEQDMIEVIGDISADSLVIVRGGERLRDGQKVAVPAAVSESPEVVSKRQ